MRLYLLRHGIAEEFRPGVADDDRQLTQEGIGEIYALGEVFQRLQLAPDVILTSPYARARRTAEIVAEALDIRERLTVDARLASGCRFHDMQQVVADQASAQRLMIVGHNPDLSQAANRLIGGAAINLKKGGLVRIDLDRFEPGQGSLEWFVTASLLIRAANS